MASRSLCRVAGAAFLLLAGACERKPAKPEGGPAPGAAQGATAQPASGASRVLATIPAGIELGETLFSPDGRHVAFVGTREGKAWAFLDGWQSAPYDAVRGLVKREGQASLAFIASRGGQELAVVDAREGRPAEAIGTLLLAPDGRPVYSARRSGRWVVVVGDREVSAPGDFDPAPLLAAGGTRVVFTELAAAGQIRLRSCVLDLTSCQAGEAFQSITQAAVDASGARLAFVAGRGSLETVAVLDLGQPGVAARTGGWYDAVALPTHSEGGGHLAFLARRGDRQLLVKDGAELELPATDAPFALEVSRGGRTLLTMMLESKLAVIVDGKRVHRAYDGLSSPVFSADGASYAYAAGQEPSCSVVVNGEEGPVYDMVVTPRLTPDGSRVVYRARRAGERFVVVADGHARTLREHPHFEAVYPVVLAPDGKSVGYGVRAGQELRWREEPL